MLTDLLLCNNFNLNSGAGGLRYLDAHASETIWNVCWGVTLFI